MRPGRRLRRLALVLAPVPLVLGFGAHRWVQSHVGWVTGGAPQAPGCVSCHFDAAGGTLTDRVLGPVYRTPLRLAVSADGSRLYATAEDGNALLVADTASRKLISVIPLPGSPRGLALAEPEATAWVTDWTHGSLLAVDLERGAVRSSLTVGRAPAAVALARRSGMAVVANAWGNDLSIVDLAEGEERLRLSAGTYPYGAVPSPDGRWILVTNRLAAPSRPPDLPVAEITLIDAAERRVVRRFQLPNAHLLEGAAFTPDGSLALVVLIRPRNLVPALQVERGWMMSSALAVVDFERDLVAQLPLDDLDAFYADPSDVAVTPDGKLAFVSHAGTDTVSVVDLEALVELVRGSSAAELARLVNRLSTSRRYVLKRIPTRANPRGLALSPDGRTLYVAERLDDSIGIIDVARLERVAAIDLEGPGHETLVRRGEKVFNSSAGTLQRQFTCRSCHPDNHMDGLSYDFEPDGLGRDVVDNRSLLGLKGTAPFKWNGKNTSLYMQCGIRFARFLTRSQPFPPEDLNALVAFISSLPAPPGGPGAPGGGLTEAQERGKRIFERAVTSDGETIAQGNRCVTCHPPPHYSDDAAHDVGSASAGDGHAEFDTPHLGGVALSPPYLHDGKALTLEEIWTLYSTEDEHGVTRDIGKQGLNDLIAYLRTL